ncbi:YggT family protein [Helicobacter himalayensis]|uniref:YggT family protein n=1 Tax=Helicobacter himalayensis TaxID=1591088 RepID=UPI00082D3E1E|nr:YggT family protein [Helicobacter himalayensis]
MLAVFLESLVSVINIALNLYIFVLIAAVLISWVRPDPYNPIVQVLYRLSEPLFSRVRRIMRTNFGGLDLAPLIVILALEFINILLVKSVPLLIQGL